MNSVAEWVEDRATIESLAQVGVDYIQGYAVAQPQDPERILRAESSAGFVDDLQLVRFLRDLGTSSAKLESWEPAGEQPRIGLH